MTYKFTLNYSIYFENIKIITYVRDMYSFFVINIYCMIFFYFLTYPYKQAVQCWTMSRCFYRFYLNSMTSRLFQLFLDDTNQVTSIRNQSVLVKNKFRWTNAKQSTAADRVTVGLYHICPCNFVMFPFSTETQFIKWHLAYRFGFRFP